LFAVHPQFLHLRNSRKRRFIINRGNIDISPDILQKLVGIGQDCIVDVVEKFHPFIIIGCRCCFGNDFTGRIGDNFDLLTIAVAKLCIVSVIDLNSNGGFAKSDTFSQQTFVIQENLVNDVAFPDLEFADKCDFVMRSPNFPQSLHYTVVRFNTEFTHFFDFSCHFTITVHFFAPLSWVVICLKRAIYFPV